MLFSSLAVLHHKGGHMRKYVAQTLKKQHGHNRVITADFKSRNNTDD